MNVSWVESTVHGVTASSHGKLAARVTLSRSSNVLVVGAGIVGCAVAYELSRRGASVQIIDDRLPGMGATQASAGMLAPYTEAKERNELFLDLAVRSLELYDEFVARVAADAGAPVGYNRAGTIEIAGTAERMTELRDIARRLASRSVALEVLDAPAARAQEPQLGGDVAGGLFIDAHGYVNALELAHGLFTAARSLGATFVDGGRVRRISRRGNDLHVEADSRTLTAQTIIVAAGSWSGQIEIAGAAAPPVRPVRGQMLHLTWKGSPPLRRVTWGERCYLVPWDDGTLLVGATMEEVGFDEKTTTAGVQDLLNAACALVPHVREAGFLGARAGLRPGTPDAMPIVGWSRRSPNVMYATGHFRNGVLLAPLTAQLVADAVLDGRVDPALDAIGPQRFGEL
jgi:glycine oxidase